MITKDDALQIVLTALRNLALTPNFDETVTDYPLFGKDSELDSIDFVTVIVDVEYQLGKQYGVNISLTSEKAMSQKNSPFRTVDTLADYIVEVVNG